MIINKLKEYGSKIGGILQKSAKTYKKYQRTIGDIANFIEQPSYQSAYSAIKTGLEEHNKSETLPFATEEYKRKIENPKLSKISDYKIE